MDGRERARWDRSDRSIGEELGERGGRVPRSVLSRRASIDVFSSGGKTSIWEGQTMSSFPFRLLNAATPSLAKASADVHESDLSPVDHLFSEIIIDI